MEVVHAYAAGLIDGEGTVSLIRNRKGKFRAPTVSMTSTTLELLSFMKGQYGGSIRRHRTYKDHHKQAWVWSIRYDRAIACLEQLLPHLKVPEKVYRARMLVFDYKQVTPRNGKYSPELLQLREEFDTQFFHPSAPSALSVQESISL